MKRVIDLSAPVTRGPPHQLSVWVRQVLARKAIASRMVRARIVESRDTISTMRGCWLNFKVALADLSPLHQLQNSRP